MPSIKLYENNEARYTGNGEARFIVISVYIGLIVM